MQNSESITVNRKPPSLFGIQRGYPILVGTALVAMGIWTIQPTQSQHTEPALDGDCPVCLMEMGKEVKGRINIQSLKDGKTYLFPGEDQKKIFDANPEKYVPAFHGYCSVCQVEINELVPGSTEHFSIHAGKLFLFATADQKKMFDANPEKYAGVALGLDGLCPVCLADGKLVQGKPEITANYDGVEYRFPSEEFKSLFLQNPQKYAPAAGGQCLVCKVDMNKNVLGSVEHSLIVGGKPFLFVDETQKKKFQRNPSEYIQAGEAGSAIRGGKVPFTGSTSSKNRPRQRRGGSGSNRR